MKVVNISELKIISAPIREKLIDFGITSLNELTTFHTSPKKCFELSSDSGIPIKELRWIINIALFSQIPGVGVNHSLMLIKIGIDSVEKLARCEADRVLFDMALYNESQAVLPILPSLLVINRWIKDAKSILEEQELTVSE